MRNFFGLGFSFTARDAASPAIEDMVDEIDRLISTADRMEAALDQRSTADRLAGSYANTSKASEGMTSTAEKLGGAFLKLNKFLLTAGGTINLFGKSADGAEGKLGGLRGTLNMFNFTKVSTGFGSMTKAIELMGKTLGQVRLSNFIQSVGAAKGAVEGFSGGLNAGLNLTSSFEGTMTSMAKSTKALGATLGYTGKELKKFSSQATSMAYGMNIGEEAAGKAIYAWDGAKEVLKELGFDGPKSIAKFTEVYGIGADKMREMALQMQKQFGMSAEQISGVMSSYVTMGKETGNVPGALEQMQQSMELLARRKALGDTPEELAAFARQTAAVGTALYNLNQNGEQATSVSAGLAQALTKAQGDMQNLFVGSGEGVGEFVEAFSQLGGDVSVATKLMEQGPQGLTEALQSIPLKELRVNHKKAYDYVRVQLEKAFGDEKMANDYMMFLENSTQATKDLMVATNGARVNLAKMGEEAYSSGLTLSDYWNKTQEQFEAGFRRIGRGAARKFVSDSSKAFKEFNNQLQAIAAEGGPLGALVTKMSEVHQIGALALIPQTLRPMASLLGEGVQMATPFIGALGSLGLRLSNLANPAFLAAAGITALGAAFMSGRSAMEDNVDALSKSAKARNKEAASLEKLEEKLRNTAEGTAAYANLETEVLKKRSAINLAEQLSVEQKAMEVLQKKAKKGGLSAADTEALDKHTKRIAALQRESLKAADEVTKLGVKTTVMTVVEGIKTFAEYLPTLLKDLVPLMVDTVKSIFGMAIDLIQDLFEGSTSVDFSGFAEGLLSDLARAFDTVVPIVTGAISAVFDEVANILSPSKAASTGVGKLVESVVRIAYQIGKQLFEGLLGFVSENAGPTFLKITEFIGEAASAIVGALPAVLDGIGSLASSILGALPGVAKTLLKGLENLDLPKLFSSVFATIGDAVSAIGSKQTKDLLSSLVKGIGELAAAVYGTLGQVVVSALGELAAIDLSGVLSTLGSVVTGYVGAIQGALKAIPWESVLSGVIDVVSSLLSALSSKATGEMLSNILAQFGSLYGAVVDIAVGAVAELVKGIGAIDFSPLISGIFSNITGAIFSAAESLLPAMQNVVENIYPILLSAVDAIINVALDLPDIFGSVMESLGGQIKAFMPKLLPLLKTAWWAGWKFLMWDLPVKVLSYLPEALYAVMVEMPKWIWKASVFVVDAVVGVADDILSALEDIPVLGWFFKQTRLFFDFWVAVWNGVKIVVDGVFSALEGIWEGLKAAFYGTVTFIQDAWNSIFGGAEASFIGGVVTSVFKIVGGVLGTVQTTFETVVAGIRSAWEGLTGWLSGVFQPIFDGIVSIFTGLSDWFSVTVLDPIVSAFTTAFNSISEVIMGPINYVIEGFKAVIRELPSSLVSDSLAEWAGLNRGSEEFQEMLSGPDSQLQFAEDRKNALLAHQEEIAKQEQQDKNRRMRADYDAQVAAINAENKYRESHGLPPLKLPTTSTGTYDALEDVTVVDKAMTPKKTGPKVLPGMPTELPVQPALAPYKIEILPPSPTLLEVLKPDLDASLKEWVSFQTTMSTSTRVFTTGISGMFKAMTLTIQSGFYDMWTAVLTDAGSSMEAFLSDLALLRGGVIELADAMETLARAKESLSQEEIIAQSPEAQMREGADAQEELFRATMAPDWYYKDYKQQFERLLTQVSALTAATKASGGSTTVTEVKTKTAAASRVKSYSANQETL